MTGSAVDKACLEYFNAYLCQILAQKWTNYEIL
jgi:hypothetical protein